MNTEANPWFQQKEDFHYWTENPANDPIDEFDDLRKSIHIYYLRKQLELLKPITNWVFKKFPLNDFLEKENQKEREFYSPVQKEPVPKYYRRHFLYRMKRVSEINEDILRGFWENDRHTIFEFYEREFSKVAWLILKNSGTLEDAKDIFQDAMVILMDKFAWSQFDLDCSLGTYIYSICKNIWKEKLRKQKKENEFTDIVYYDSTEISTDYYNEKPDIFHQVTKAIEKLGNPCKKLIELYYFENYSWEEIAAKLGYASAASARNQKYKCLERIRGKL
jgi:RNA polymerase sigma factor (sigma-70 family)